MENADGRIAVLKFLDQVEGTAMQIHKELINDRLSLPKVS